VVELTLHDVLPVFHDLVRAVETDDVMKLSLAQGSSHLYFGISFETVCRV